MGRVSETCDINLRYEHAPYRWQRRLGTPTPFMTLTNAVRSGTNSRYETAAQRRSHLTLGVGVVQITERATGRRVTISGNAMTEDTSSISAANSVLGYLLTRGLHGKDSAKVLTAMDNLFTFCWNGGPTRERGPKRVAETMFAAYGVSDVADVWLDHPYWTDWLDGDRRRHPEAVAVLAATGVAPGPAANFVAEFTVAHRASLPNDPPMRGATFFDRATAPAIARFVAAGWSGGDAFMAATTTAPALRYNDPLASLKDVEVRTWLRVRSPAASLAVRAGLGPREALGMQRGGGLDEEVLRTMAGLNRRA